MTITEFLLARIAEDETKAEGVSEPLFDGDDFSIRFASWESDHSQGDSAFVDHFNPARVLVECEAKRRLVALLAPHVTAEAFRWSDIYKDGTSDLADDVLHILASSYADHPDYDEAWRVSS